MYFGWAGSLLLHMGFLSVVSGASHHAGFSCSGARALGHKGFLAVAPGLSCPEASGVFLDQVSNPCPLHWQAGSTIAPPEKSLNFLLDLCSFLIGLILPVDVPS